MWRQVEPLHLVAPGVGAARLPVDPGELSLPGPAAVSQPPSA